MVSPRTIAHLYRDRVVEAPNQPAYYSLVGGVWASTTMQAALTDAYGIGAGLVSLGITHGDRVAVMADSRPEWLLCDAAVLAVGGVVVSIYPTSTADTVAYILEHSDAKVVFAETADHAALIESRLAALPDMDSIIVIEPGESDRWTSLSDLQEAGRKLLEAEPTLVDARLDTVQPGDLASLMYTSGTTGRPKGVPLTHDAILTVVESLVEPYDLRPGDSGVIYLPMSHILQRMMFYVGLTVGMLGYFAPAVTELVSTCQVANPSTVGGVPRVYEKIHAAIMARLSEAPPAQRRFIQRALDVGKRRARLEDAGDPIPLGLRLRSGFFDRLIFRKVRSSIFGDNIKFLSCGSAPIAIELLEFFHAIGLPVYEAYGLTEAPAVTANLPARHRGGSVGVPLPGTQVRIADDGEVLVKGFGVFEGYYGDPESTAAAFTADGWFATGDVGRLDEDGFLHITDRKKSLIITAGGKNIAPAPIELRLCQHPLVGQAVVHGDRRKYLTALLSIDPEAVPAWVSAARVDPSPGLVDNAALQAELRAYVATVNENLARYETIKDFRVVPEEFSVENGLLTPSLKVKRRDVETRYRSLLDEMYDTER